MHRWRRWHGTLDQLERVVDQAKAELRKWQGSEPSLHVDVTERGDATATNLSFQDLRAMGPDIRHIRRLSIVVGERYNTPHVELTLGAQYVWPLQLEVQGRERSPTLGLKQTLQATLGQDHPLDFVMRPVFTLPVATLLAVVVFAGVAIGLLQAFDSVGGISARDALILILVIVGCAVLAPLLVWTFPGVEILDPHEPTRPRRFFVALLGVVVSFAVAVIAILVTNALSTPKK